MWFPFAICEVRAPGWRAPVEGMSHKPSPAIGARTVPVRSSREPADAVGFSAIVALLPLLRAGTARAPSFRQHTLDTPSIKALVLVCLPLLTSLGDAFAIGQARYVEPAASEGSFCIVEGKVAAPIWVDTNDHPGVLRAAGDLQADIARVTSVTPALTRQNTDPRGRAIIVGTVGKSRIIDRLIRQGKIDTSPIVGINPDASAPRLCTPPPATHMATTTRTLAHVSDPTTSCHQDGTRLAVLDRVGEAPASPAAVATVCRSAVAVTETPHRCWRATSRAAPVDVSVAVPPVRWLSRVWERDVGWVDPAETEQSR